MRYKRPRTLEGEGNAVANLVAEKLKDALIGDGLEGQQGEEADHGGPAVEPLGVEVEAVACGGEVRALGGLGGGGRGLGEEDCLGRGLILLEGIKGTGHYPTGNRGAGSRAPL